MISSRLNVLACQRPSLSEIHTGIRKEMLKPLCGGAYGAGGLMPQKEIGVQFERGVFILKAADFTKTNK